MVSGFHLIHVLSFCNYKRSKIKGPQVMFEQNEIEEKAESGKERSEKCGRNIRCWLRCDV